MTIPELETALLYHSHLTSVTSCVGTNDMTQLNLSKNFGDFGRSIARLAMIEPFDYDMWLTTEPEQPEPKEECFIFSGGQWLYIGDDL